VVDKTFVLGKIAALDEVLGQVREYEHITVDAYRSDWKTQRIVERTLQMMIETCLDISGHIISDAGLPVPQTYADMFRVLAANHVLDESRLDAFERMARFRNVVVHGYEKIDPEIVVGVLKNNLSDFVLFKESILRYLS
jgi:uncharacterized protein YutE (UPF0331/DUF86 family)